MRALAAASGFSPSFISQVENGLASPSVASLRRIAGALGATLGEFFEQAVTEPPAGAQEGRPEPSGTHPSAPAIIRAGRRRRLVSSWSRAMIEGMGRADTGHSLEPLLITFFPGGRSGSDLQAVPSEQLALVLSGEVTLVRQGGADVLGPGDAVALPPHAPHRWENAGTEVARLLLVAQRTATPKSKVPPT